MSKTSEKNSDRQKTTFLSKPLKVLGIDLLERYKQDLFLSTHTQIILFHVFFVIIVIIVTTQLIEYVQRTTLDTVVGAVQQMLRSGTYDAASLRESASSIDTTMSYVFLLIVAAAIGFGISASRLALRPVRQALILQQRFVSSIAHELRTPLAVLKTQNEVAKLDIDDSSPISETLTQNVEEIDHITEILNNLLLFNRVDTLESISFDMVSLDTIITGVVARLKPLANKKGIVLVYTPTVMPDVYGNETALEQALFNMVRNGINYTNRGGEVAIKCSSITERTVSVSVADNGIGIGRSDLRHIFEPFFRSESGQIKSRGTGLGLALVFEIMKLHKGRVNVESEVGRGTRFEITIPRTPQLSAQLQSHNDVGVTYDFSSHTK